MTVQLLSGGRPDEMLGRGTSRPVYPWFGKDTPLTGFTSVPRPLHGTPPFVWHASVASLPGPKSINGSAVVVALRCRDAAGAKATHPWQGLPHDSSRGDPDS